MRGKSASKSMRSDVFYASANGNLPYYVLYSHLGKRAFPRRPGQFEACNQLLVFFLGQLVGYTPGRSKALVPLYPFAPKSARLAPFRLPLPFRCKQAAFLNRQVFLEYKSISPSRDVMTYRVHSILGKEHSPHLPKLSSNARALSVEVEILNSESYGFA